MWRTTDTRAFSKQNLGVNSHISWVSDFTPLLIDSVNKLRSNHVRRVIQEIREIIRVSSMKGGLWHCEPELEWDFTSRIQWLCRKKEIYKLEVGIPSTLLKLNDESIDVDVGNNGSTHHPTTVNVSGYFRNHRGTIILGLENSARDTMQAI